MLSALAGYPAAGNEVKSMREEFVSTYRCMIVEQFKVISERGTKAKSENRYFILAMRDFPQGFVQCIFYEYDSKLLCEASSGRYGPSSGQPNSLTLSDESIAELGSLGFQEPFGVANFSEEIALGDPPDFDGISELLLKAMFSAYSARIDTPMTLTTPLLDRNPRRLLSCKPVS